jgi:hypothetical protein
MGDPAVERFVRETLGCGCPDEVFGDLRVEPAGDGYEAAIHVGGRLLVLLLRAADGVTQQRFARAVAGGIARRDKEGYNRLRLVVVTDRQETAAIEAAFSPLLDGHDRVHLHVVSAAECPLPL